MNLENIANEELKKTFRPEFLNRVDDIVVFNQLKEIKYPQSWKDLKDEKVEKKETIKYPRRYC